MGVFTRIFGSASEGAIANAVERVLEDKLYDTIRTFTNLDTANERLRSINTQYKVLEETIAREKLDMKHKLGLERMRQEQEAEIAKERLEAQKDAIEAEKDLAVQAARFEAKAEALTETRETMKEFQETQKEMIESLLKALPSAEIFAKVGK